MIMAARKNSKAATKFKNGVPQGFTKVETTMAGFWKPEIVGQSVQGTVGEAIEVAGPDGRTNTFYSFTLTSSEGGPIVGKDNKKVPTVAGQMVGLGGKMLLIFLRGREGKEVYITYAGLGPAKSGQSAPKLFETYSRDEE